MKKTLIAVSLALPLAAVSCGTLKELSQSSLSQEQVAELDAQTAKIAALEQSIETMETQAEELSKAIADDAKAGRLEQLNGRLSLFLDLQESHEAAVKQYAVAVEEEREIIGSGTKKVVDGFLAVASPFIPPPAQPLLPFASSLLVMALSSRARKHAGKALAATAKGNVGEAISFILKGVGAKHSNDTAEGVLSGAIKVAEHQVARGELDLAKLEALKEAQAKLEA